MGHHLRRLRLNRIRISTEGDYRDLWGDEYEDSNVAYSIRLAAVQRVCRIRFPHLSDNEVCALAIAEARKHAGHEGDVEPEDERLQALGLLDERGWPTFVVTDAEAEAMLDNATYQRELVAARRARQRKLRR